MKTIISKSEKETWKIAEQIAAKLKAGDVLALVGDLGGGKTQFTKGIAKYFGIKDEIQSPTFTLIREYQLSRRQIRKFYHMDMYRLKCEDEVKELGLEEIFENPDSISVIEWADKIKKILPKRTKFIEFDFMDENTRKILLK